MGVVYKAEDTKLKRPVALKFLPPAFATDPTTKERFIHEAQSASALQHSNICTIHEIDETDDGQLFISMDYYEGKTLKEKLEAGKIDVETAIDYTIQIAKGLQKAHEKEIIHRDIKPSNIRVKTNGTPIIIDFGLARHLDLPDLTSTSQGAAIGTVAYFAPEQFIGTKYDIDHRTDLFALGILIYYAITGQHPYWQLGMSMSDLKIACCEKSDYLNAEYFQSLPSEWKTLLKRIQTCLYLKKVLELC